MNKRSPTVLHQLFRVSPGNLPRWIVSTNDCDGIDALVFVAALGGVGTVMLLFRRPWLALPAAVAVVFYVRLIWLPVDSVERRARRDARRNRTRQDATSAADGLD